MENDNLKIQLDSIQRILSYCITQTYNVLIGNILRKKSCINNIQFKEILQKEYIRISDELSSIYLNYPTLVCVEKYYNDDDFLWESTFFESLTKEQKQKYASFSVSSFEYVRCILVYDFPKATIIWSNTAEVLITHIFDVTHDRGGTNSYGSSKFNLSNIRIFSH